MNVVDIIILISVIAIVGLILFFNIRNFKKGENKCTKCPYASKCTRIETNPCGTENKKEEIKNEDNKN